jgi:hypothetical protein
MSKAGPVTASGKCKFGKVKRGPRKGVCRKSKVAPKK